MAQQETQGKDQGKTSLAKLVVTHAKAILWVSAASKHKPPAVAISGLRGPWSKQEKQMDVLNLPANCPDFTHL